MAPEDLFWEGHVLAVVAEWWISNKPVKTVKSKKVVNIGRPSELIDVEVHNVEDNSEAPHINGICVLRVASCDENFWC